MSFIRIHIKQSLSPDKKSEEKHIKPFMDMNISALINTMKNKDLANKISSYLTTQEYKNLKTLSRDFHGPIKKNNHIRWADKGGIGLLRKQIKATKTIQEEYSDKCSCVCATCIAGYTLLPCNLVLSIGGCIGFFSGAVKDVCCSGIRPYDGQQIEFVTPESARNLRSEIIPAPKTESMEDDKHINMHYTNLKKI